ncbi:MAG: type I CRISPR-associated protein Cas7 [Gemmataceae bacterium]|nr:type I CRISPR-associated protein Cas7 [Gemmataceae bacterium]
MSKSNAPFARAVGLLVIEVAASNPNGDPDRESDPRHRPDGHGEISPVSFKRKVRDVVENKEGVAWRELAAQLKLDGDGFGILESRGRDRPVITGEIISGTFTQKYWDARVFGNTFLENLETTTLIDTKGTKRKPTDPEKKLLRDSIKTGAVQFGVGLSVAPVLIDRRTLISKPGVEEGKNQGMAPLAFRVVQHGVYVMPFFVNPNVAHKTGCTSEDIKLLLRVIPTGYDLNKSLVRPDVRMRHAWYVEHRHVLGSCSDFALIEALTPKRKGDDPRAPSTRWDDYDVPTKLPEALEAKVEPLRDLVEESHAAVRA